MKNKMLNKNVLLFQKRVTEDTEASEFKFLFKYHQSSIKCSAYVYS